MKNEPFVIERTYNVPVARVWKALTDKEDMRKWYFDVDDFKPEVGFEFHFTGQGEGVTYMHICKITEVIAGKKISYSWRYKGHEGISYVSFELSDEGGKTKLKLTHEGLETFPAIQAFAKENFVMGWTELIGRSLPGFLGVTVS